MATHDDELMRELLETFQVEAVEHLQKLNQTLLALERQPQGAVRAELVQEAFRAAHSLKGAARTVEFMEVEGLAHGIEEVLKQARDERLQLVPATCDVLYLTLDAIQRLIAGEPVDSEPLHDKLRAIDDSKTRLGGDGETPAATGAPSPAVQPEGDETIRVAISKLDALMAQMGELLSARISAEQRTADMKGVRQQLTQFPRMLRDIKALGVRLSHNGEDGQRLAQMLHQLDDRLRDLIHDLNAIDTSVSRDSLRLGMVTGELQDEMRRVRMVSFQTLEPLFQRTVRDAARTDGKQADLTVEGGEVELDKKVLETLKDPFLHLLRNAVSHGIETPEVRAQRDKPAAGQIAISITQRGSEAHIVVRDDGGGFDLDGLRKSAESQQAALTDNAGADEIINMAFFPGITTSGQLTHLSGRGVGLDVVRRQIETLQGRILVENLPGKGASFQLIVPVSLAMTRVLLVQADSQRFALPLAAIEKITRPQNLFSVEGQTMLTVDQKPLPLLPLASALNLPGQPSQGAVAIVVGSADLRIALLVDDVLTEQELAVKPLGKPIIRVRNLAGAAIMGNGEPIVVLNIADVVKSARGLRVEYVPHRGVHQDNGQPTVERILVVDDSITTRTLEKNILEAAGYEVHTATDGLQALQQLKSQSIALIVLDVEMPNMDGFTLTRHLRDSKEYKDLPVILVTSRESPEDRERGMTAGANAYIVKRGFNQAELLSTIRQFL